MNKKLFIIFIYCSVSTVLLLPQKIFATISFTIATSSTTYTKDDEIPIQVQIAGLTAASCTTCYLQVAFTSSLDNPRYLGLSRGSNGSYFSYLSSPATDTIKQTFFSFQPVSGSWSGTTYAKIDTADSDYAGSGQYYVKLLRYTGNSTSGTWSDNSVLLTIIDNTPTDAPIPPTPTKVPTPTPTPKVPTATSTPKSTASTSYSSKIASVISKAVLSPTSSLLSVTGATSTGVLATKNEKSSQTSANISPTKVPVKVAGITDFIGPLFMGIGGILLVSCAILMYWNVKKQRDYE